LCLGLETEVKKYTQFCCVGEDAAKVMYIEYEHMIIKNKGIVN